MRKFPFWIFPLTLFLFVTGIFTWLGMTGKFPWKTQFYQDLPIERSRPEKRIPSEKKEKRPGTTQESEMKQKSDETFFMELPEKFEKNLAEREVQKNQEQEQNRKREVTELYQKGFRLFSAADYDQAALHFEEFQVRSISFSGMEEKQFKAKIYTAYAYLFLSDQRQSEKLAEKSRVIFLDLYRNLPSKSELSPQIVLGLARSSRFMEDYPDGIEIILKENLIRAPQGLQRHFYLELGYYYFQEKKMEQALTYFQKSGLPIANRHFYEILLETEGTSLYLLTLLSRGMIPGHSLKDYKTEIQKKILQEARSDYQNQKKEEAFFLLKKLLTEFPGEAVTEEANFWLGELYTRELQYQKAIYFYDQTLSNEFLDYDAAALFKKALLYNQSGNPEEALKNFNLIRQNFVSSQYYQPAMDWIREIERKRSEPSLGSRQPLKEGEIQRPVKQKEHSDDELFFKDEISSDDLY